MEHVHEHGLLQHFLLYPRTSSPMSLGSVVSNHTTLVYLFCDVSGFGELLPLYMVKLVTGLLAAILPSADNQLLPDLLISLTWCQKTKVPVQSGIPMPSAAAVMWLPALLQEQVALLGKDSIKQKHFPDPKDMFNNNHPGLWTHSLATGLGSIYPPPILVWGVLE